MNNSLLIRVAATLAALSLVVVASTAAASQLPPPLGAGHQALSPGVQVLDLVSRETSPGGPAQLPQIQLTLPKGWFNYDGWGMNDGGALIRRAALSFWDVNKVYPTGCHWASKPMIDPGPTVDGLARVLYARPLRHASKPRGVTLGGFHGKYLRWSVPRNMSWAHCRQGYFESWTAKGWASDRYQQGGGQVDRLWILNVDGQRLVIDAAYGEGATKKQRVELNRIVHSIHFLPESTQTPASTALSSGSTSVWASGINNRGQVIGTLTRGHASHPFVWRKGSLKLFGTGKAEAINGRGEVVATNARSQNVLWENGIASAIAAGSFNDAQGQTRTTIGCMQPSKLKGVFPPARTAGFAGRSHIKVQGARDPIYPGRCSAFWATYSVRPGETVDVVVTLYKSAKDLSAPLAEAAVGPVRRLSNGARVRTFQGSSGVNGAPAKDTYVESAYRKILIQGTSISTAGTPVPIPAQLRLHRLIENAFTRAQATH